MVAPRFAKLFAVAVSTAFVCSVAGMPAYALTDTNLDGTTGASTGTSAITPMSTDESSSLQNQPSADDAESMPDNPTKDLPQTVSEEIPDDATVVSEELAVTDDGEVMDLETGDTVTDPQLVGTVDKPADPLAKTDGESFIPVEVAEVKDAMGTLRPFPILTTRPMRPIRRMRRTTATLRSRSRMPRTRVRRVPWCGLRPCRTTRTVPTGVRIAAPRRSSRPMARCSCSRPRA